MRQRKIKTPEELATPSGKRAYSLYLDSKQMDYITARAARAKVARSKLVDEAIAAYIARIREKKD